MPRRKKEEDLAPGALDGALVIYTDGACSGNPGPGPVILFTDSTYVLKGITEWIHGWKKRGWKKSDKKPVINKDLWQKLDALNSQRDIQWKWVKGHNGDVGNEKADELARRGIPGSKGL